MRCSTPFALTLVLSTGVLGGCGTTEPSLMPTQVSERGNEELRVHLAAPTQGPVVVLVDGVPAHSIVVEGPHLIRAQLPSLPRTGQFDVEVLSGDGEVLELARALEVTAAKLEVRARPDPAP